jgi:hypothetical protein
MLCLELEMYDNDNRNYNVIGCLSLVTLLVSSSVNILSSR